MIEHRLYSVEKNEPNQHYSGHQQQYDLVIMTPTRAAWYGLLGYTLFDLSESLAMEPEYYEQERELRLTNKYPTNSVVDSATK